MPFTIITKPSAGTPTKKSLIWAIIDNLTFLFSQTQGPSTSVDSIPNGSFENDTDADGTPDSWVLTTWGTFTLDTSAGNQSIGSQSAKFVSTGAGGGYLTSEDYFEVSDKRSMSLSFQLKSSVADVRNKVEILFYDRTKSFISSATLYDNATTNPTAWTTQFAYFVPVATARYAKLKITGCDSSDATAGSTWYDDFRFTQLFISVPVIQAFSASGSFTVPAYVSRIRIRVWAGGGGGGGGNNSGAPTYAGGGGGGGAYAEGNFAVTPGTVYTVTIGAGGAGGASGVNGSNGGTSSVGALISCTGGSLGTAGAIGANGTGGAGGTSAASFNIAGQAGLAGRNDGTNAFLLSGGDGGASFGSSQQAAASGNGRGPGGGGAGGNKSSSGGTGANGYVVIEY